MGNKRIPFVVAMEAPLEKGVTEFGAGALWAIGQAIALAVPGAFGVHELFAAAALVVVVILFQVVFYGAGAPNAAVMLAAYVSGEEKSVAATLRMVLATMAGAVVGAVFARDTLLHFALPVDGIRPPISFFPEYGSNFVLALEAVTSLLICSFSLLVLPKRFFIGLAGLFIIPVPAALLGVPGIDPAWSLGRAVAAKNFANNSLYLLGPFGGALAFGVACRLGKILKKLTKTSKKKKKN